MTIFSISFSSNLIFGKLKEIVGFLSYTANLSQSDTHLLTQCDRPSMRIHIYMETVLLVICEGLVYSYYYGKKFLASNLHINFYWFMYCFLLIFILLNVNRIQKILQISLLNLLERILRFRKLR